MSIKKIYIYLFFSLNVLFFNQKMHSQTIPKEVTNQLKNELQNVSTKRATDAIYLQTSKDIYETEEDLWFKGYVLDAQYFIPSKKNKILYVQLINDETKKAVWEEKYEIENGFVDGHLFIQDSLKTGKYSLSAYSQNSFFKNQKEFYALKKITIIKKVQEKIVVTPIKNDSIAQFSLFPEGGYLVDDLENTLAFKAENKKGLPVKVSGTLYEDQLPILNFKSVHDGLGRFIFKPNKFKTYYIQLTETGTKKYQLPEIKGSGKVLRLQTNSKDFLRFIISGNKNIEKETIYLRLQIRGVIYSIASAKFKNNILIQIPLKDVPQGIAEVTLFDTNLQPIAERLVYVKPNEKLNIETSFNKIKHKTRDKLTLKIKVTDKDDNPVIANLGLSVYDRIYKNKSNQKNILSHYYVSSQLKGSVYNPSYYFNSENKNRQEVLNLLLLTHGWRKYVWNENNLKEQGERLNPIVSDSIQATISTKKKKDLETSLFVSLFNGSEERSSKFIEVDTTHQFFITPTHFKMGEKGFIYLKPLTPEKPRYKININDFNFSKINESRKGKNIFYPIAEIEEANNKEIVLFKIPKEVTQLDEIKIKTKGNRIFRDKYLGKLDSLAKADLCTDYVCGVGGTEAHMFLNCPHHLYHKDHTKPIEGETYYVYGEGLVINEEKKTFAPKGGTQTVVYHYPELTEAYLLEKYNLRMLKGYYGKRVFYNPVYDKESINAPFLDYRNTLFWKPDIITNKNGEATVEFYTSDINTYFTGNIEGVSGAGLLGVGDFDFQVIKR